MFKFNAGQIAVVSKGDVTDANVGKMVLILFAVPVRSKTQALTQTGYVSVAFEPMDMQQTDEQGIVKSYIGLLTEDRLTPVNLEPFLKTLPQQKLVAAKMIESALKLSPSFMNIVQREQGFETLDQAADSIIERLNADFEMLFNQKEDPSMNPEDLIGDGVTVQVLPCECNSCSKCCDPKHPKHSEA